jgi:hypothetical protein
MLVAPISLPSAAEVASFTRQLPPGSTPDSHLTQPAPAASPKRLLTPRFSLDLHLIPTGFAPDAARPGRVWPAPGGAARKRAGRDAPRARLGEVRPALCAPDLRPMATYPLTLPAGAVGCVHGHRRHAVAGPARTHPLIDADGSTSLAPTADINSARGPPGPKSPPGSLPRTGSSESAGGERPTPLFRGGSTATAVYPPPAAAAGRVYSTGGRSPGPGPSGRALRVWSRASGRAGRAPGGGAPEGRNGPGCGVGRASRTRAPGASRRSQCSTCEEEQPAGWALEGGLSDATRCRLVRLKSGGNQVEIMCKSGVNQMNVRCKLQQGLVSCLQRACLLSVAELGDMRGAECGACGSHGGSLARPFNAVSPTLHHSLSSTDFMPKNKLCSSYMHLIESGACQVQSPTSPLAFTVGSDSENVRGEDLIFKTSKMFLKS